MTLRQPYTYTILRYVHDVVTGEFINVGVLMFVPRSNLVKFGGRSSIGRIKQVFPDLNRTAFLSGVRAVERSATRIAKQLKQGDLLSEHKDASSIARTILMTDDSSLQWSPIAGGVTDNPEKTFDRLYCRFVSRYDTKTTHRRTDDDIWKPVRALLESRAVPVQFDEKQVTGRTDEIVFKRAWKNGMWHAYEPLSFDLADADGIKDKARRWRGHLEAVRDGATVDVKLHFLVGAPQDSTLEPAYRNAIKILSEAAFEPEIFEETQISTLVNQIEDEVREHAITPQRPT
ncbi:DUF3037 domain-containing protein [Labrys okinawensis]|uniref:DUF3037 domain-containing protein n=1 Tax=Labrys okinawensis TaxID=346911 RepID=UPI0039BCEDDA